MTSNFSSNESSNSKSSSQPTAKGKARITYKNQVKDDGVFIIISRILDTDTYFTVNQMPFYRSRDDTDEWTTPHNSNWRFKEESGGFEIPMDIFLSPR